MLEQNPFDLLEKIELREPGPRALATLSAHGSKRGMPKDLLQPQDGHCAWCEIRLIPSKNRTRKYCSPDCNDSSLFNCYPQTASAKGYILINLPECACAYCEAEKALGETAEFSSLHGRNSTYTAGCRCAKCREARKLYAREWRAGRDV